MAYTVSDTQAQALAQSLRLGLSLESACRKEDIPIEDIADMIRESRETPRGRGKRSERLAALRRLYDSAVATCETHLVASVVSHVASDWRAGVWLLERRFPDKWGPRRAEMTHSDDMADTGAVVFRLELQEKSA